MFSDSISCVKIEMLPCFDLQDFDVLLLNFKLNLKLLLIQTELSQEGRKYVNHSTPHYCNRRRSAF